MNRNSLSPAADGIIEHTDARTTSPSSRTLRGEALAAGSEYEGLCREALREVFN